MSPADALIPFVWPLTAFVCFCLLLWRVGDEAKAFALWISKAVSAQANRNPMFYVIAIGFWLQAFGTGFYDNFWTIEPANMAALGWWQVLAALLKANSFAIGIMVGYALKDRNNEPKPDATVTSTTEIKTETSATPKIP